MKSKKILFKYYSLRKKGLFISSFMNRYMSDFEDIIEPKTCRLSSDQVKLTL